MPIYHRVKIIPTPDDHQFQANSYSNTQKSSRGGHGPPSSATTTKNKFPVAIQFALHGLIKKNPNPSNRSTATPAATTTQPFSKQNSQSSKMLLGAPPPARTLFFCIASAQLFPTPDALSRVCADPIDFARICAKYGRGGELPRPDFVSGYTRALPVAQYHRAAAIAGAGDGGGGGCGGGGGLQDDDDDSDDDEDDDGEQRKEQEMINAKRGIHKQLPNTSDNPVPKRSPKPRWVFVGEARVLVSEQMIASLLGETTQRFIVLFTSAFFDRSNQDGGISASFSSSASSPRHNHPRVAGSPFAQPLVKIAGDSRSTSATTDRRQQKQQRQHQNDFNINQTSLRNLTHKDQDEHLKLHQRQRRGSSPPKLTREDCVSFCEMTPELTSTDLNIILGPHDRTWLFRFSRDDEETVQQQPQQRQRGRHPDDDDHTRNDDRNIHDVLLTGIPATMKRANRRRMMCRDPFEAAKQMCKHRMHLGDIEMMKQMARKFNEFLVGATQDCRRFCSFQAARMKIPIAFEHGMRSPQCQAFLQFLRESRTLVSDKCIPAPPPHLVAHTIPPEFLEESPLLEVIADLSVRFDRYRHHQNQDDRGDRQGDTRTRKGRNWQLQHHQQRRRSDDDGDDENGDDVDDDRGVYGEDNDFFEQEQREATEANHSSGKVRTSKISKHLLPHEQQGYYGPEVRSVFAPWRIEWLDYLLLVCVETRLWRELSTLVGRFYELSDAQLLKHPEYNHEETAFRVNLFANAADIELATGHGFELSDAVRIAHRCSQFCKASPENRALVFRIRHMTQVPYIQRVLFDSNICMFEELCSSVSTTTMNRHHDDANSENNPHSSSSIYCAESSSKKATLGRILWSLLVPVKLQKHVTAVIGSRENGVHMITTPKVAARQFRSFVLCSRIGDEAFRGLIKRKFHGWVQLIRERRVKRKQALQLQMTVRHSMVQNMDSRKMYYMRWQQYAIRQRNLRRQGKIPPRGKKE